MTQQHLAIARQRQQQITMSNVPPKEESAHSDDEQNEICGFPIWTI